MLCPKCTRTIPNDAALCCYCGKQIAKSKRKPKMRGNGQGTAVLAPNGKSWIAVSTVYTPSRNVRKKSGFPSRTAALAYCPIMRAEQLNEEPKREPKTLKQVYDEWEPWYENRVKSMSGYSAAFAYYGPLHGRLIETITAGELQTCMDDCKRGKRTHQMMKVLAGLLWGYAYDRKYVERKITDNLYTGKGTSKKREALTTEEVEEIRRAIGKYRYAEYIYCHCYLGFRPGEMLELRKDQLHHDEKKDIWYLVEGKKTDAGRNRIVPIPDKIIDYVLPRAYVPGTDLLFPRYNFTKEQKATFLGFQEMDDAFFRKSVFKRLMASLGIAEGKVPYAARHTYADMLKNAKGNDRDKAALIGHSDYTFTQTNYQSTNLDELNDIAKSL